MSVLRTNGGRARSTVYAFGLRMTYSRHEIQLVLLRGLYSIAVGLSCLVQVFPSKAIIDPRMSMAAMMLALRSVRRVSTSPVVLRETAPSLMFVEIIMQKSGRSGHGGLDPGSAPHTPLLLR